MRFWPKRALARARSTRRWRQPNTRSRWASEGRQKLLAAAWRALGRVAALLPHPVAVEDRAGIQRQYDVPACFAESLRICDETGMEGDRARTLRAWALYGFERGDRVRGAAFWHEAREIFARLGAYHEVERMDSSTPETVSCRY
jgi:hypothetical protein